MPFHSPAKDGRSAARHCDARFEAIDFFSMSGKPENSTPFIGAWTLLSYELSLPSGVVEKPLGDHPLGRILYLDNGQMSAQIVAAAGADPLANDDPREATPEEAACAWRNYLGYWGTFTVDAEAGEVIHAVEGAWFPNWIGQKQIRQYRFSGNTLTLEADSPDWRATLIWRRIE
jgi:hypothetical protein